MTALASAPADVGGGEIPTAPNRLGDVSLLVAAGVAIVAVANAAARGGAAWAEPIFWIGLAVTVVGPARRCLGHAAGARERIGIVVVLTGALYLVKLLHSPGDFTFHDEFTHLRTLEDIVRSGKAFSRNPILPPSAQYPGMHLTVAAVVQVTGVSAFVAGAVVIGVAKLLLSLSLYLVVRRTFDSDRTASIAVLVYMIHPNYLFWTSQFAYESFALPLAVFALYLVVDRKRFDHAVLAAPAIIGVFVAVVASHHATAYFLIIVLISWAIVSVVMQRRSAAGADAEGSVGLAASAFAVTALWALTVGGSTYDYLFPHARSAASEVADLATGGDGPRRLFLSAGRTAPLWQQALGLLFVALILTLLVYGLWHLRRSTAGHNPLLLLLFVLGALYPAALLVRFTNAGQEISNRSSEFVFIGVAAVVSFALVRLVGEHGRYGSGTGSGLYVVLTMGAFVIGWAFYARLPGPYLVSAGGRSVGPASVAASRWVSEALPPGVRIATDRMQTVQVGAAGAHPVTSFDGVSTWPLFFDERTGDRVLEVLREGDVAYVQVDRRQSAGLPYDGVYIERGEPSGRRITDAALAKFERERGRYDRVYDNGAIVIYRVRHVQEDDTVQQDGTQ